MDYNDGDITTLVEAFADGQRPLQQNYGSTALATLTLQHLAAGWLSTQGEGMHGLQVCVRQHPSVFLEPSSLQAIHRRPVATTISASAMHSSQQCETPA